MKDIVIIDHEPLTPRRKQIFYIDELRAGGFNVQFWDCSRVIHRNFSLADTLEEPYVSVIGNHKELENKLSQTDTSNIIFVGEVFELWKNRKFFNTINNHHIQLIRMWMYSTAIINAPFSQKLKELTPKRVLKSIKNRLSTAAMRFYFRRCHITAYPHLITTDRNPRAELVLNHPDWDLYLKTSGKPRSSDLPTVPYAVFLDEFFPLHPDAKLILGEDLSQYANDYYKTLRDFFAWYEQATGQHVIIAAHPKSDYPDKVFGGRKIMKYRSIELVQHAEAVFLHGSASVSFAVMYNKPTLFITTDQYNRSERSARHIKELSKLLGKAPVNISFEKQPIPGITPFKDPIRDNYIYQFLTTPQTMDKENKDLLLKYFLNFKP